MREVMHAWLNPSLATSESRRKLGALFGAAFAVFEGIGLLTNVSGIIWSGLGFLIAWAVLFAPIFLKREVR
jgi:hypothetical protein